MQKEILCCSAKLGTSSGQATERRSKYYIYSVETNFQDDQYSSAGRVSYISILIIFAAAKFLIHDM